MQCPLTGYKTNCTDRCSDCAKDEQKEAIEGKILNAMEIELLLKFNLDNNNTK